MPESLFPEIVDPVPPLDRPAAKRMSAGRRLTERRKALVKAGYHPMANLLPGLKLLAPNPHKATCGNCALLARNERGYPKCQLHPSHSAASDVRLRWPACVRWKLPAPGIIDE